MLALSNSKWISALTTCVLLPLDSNQMNNIVQTSTLITQPYPALGQITSPYEQQKPVKDLNKYATLKAVGKRLFTMSQDDKTTFIIKSD